MENAIGLNSDYENPNNAHSHKRTNVSTGNFIQPRNASKNSQKHTKTNNTTTTPNSASSANSSPADTEEQEQWARYKTAFQADPCGQDTIQAKQILFFRYLYLAEQAANRYTRHHLPYRSLMDVDDIHSEAIAGLLDAIENFIPNSGTSFKTFSRYRIRGAIIDGLRNLQNFPRFISKVRRELKPLIEELSQELCRTPTTEELIARFPYHRIGDEYLYDVLRHPLVSANVFNQTAKANGDDSEGEDSPIENSLYARSKNRQTSPSDCLQRCDIIAKVLALLDDEHEKQVIFYYYFLGMTSQEISKIVKLSLTWVSTKKMDGVKNLRRAARNGSSDLRELLLSLATAK